MDISNSVLIQWVAPSLGTNTVNFPTAFTTVVFYYSVKGNFQSYQDGTATYNDISAYTGFINTSVLTKTSFSFRCDASAPECLFIGV